MPAFDLALCTAGSSWRAGGRNLQGQTSLAGCTFGTPHTKQKTRTKMPSQKQLQMQHFANALQCLSLRYTLPSRKFSAECPIPCKWIFEMPVAFWAAKAQQAFCTLGLAADSLFGCSEKHPHRAHAFNWFSGNNANDEAMQSSLASQAVKRPTQIERIESFRIA